MILVQGEGFQIMFPYPSMSMSKNVPLEINILWQIGPSVFLLSCLKTNMSTSGAGFHLVQWAVPWCLVQCSGQHWDRDWPHRIFLCECFKGSCKQKKSFFWRLPYGHSWQLGNLTSGNVSSCHRWNVFLKMLSKTSATTFICKRRIRTLITDF